MQNFISSLVIFYALGAFPCYKWPNIEKQSRHLVTLIMESTVKLSAMASRWVSQQLFDALLQKKYKKKNSKQKQEEGRGGGVGEGAKGDFSDATVNI